MCFSRTCVVALALVLSCTSAQNDKASDNNPDASVPVSESVYKTFIVGDVGPPPKDCTSEENIREEIESAMQAKNTARTWMLCQECYLEYLGDEAGIPTEQLQYAPLVAEQLSLEDLEVDYEAYWDQLKTVFSRDGEMRDNRPHLFREYASPAINLIDFVQTDVAEKEELVRFLGEMAAGLIPLQTSIGLFGTPDFRDVEIDPRDTLKTTLEMIKQVQREELSARDFENGWQVSDLTAGMQFDNGLMMAFLARLYQATSNSSGDWNYLPNRDDLLLAAESAAAWAEGQRCVSNFNYCSFTAYGGAHLYEATGEERWREMAVEKMKLGVFPGTIPAGHFGDHRDGRYMDHHNAKNVYHWIMVRAAIATLSIVPTDHPERAFVEYYTNLIFDGGVREVTDFGVGKRSPAHEMSDYCRRFGCSAEVERALTATIYWNHQVSGDAIGSYYRYRVQNQ